jgi:hypothetical protein
MKPTEAEEHLRVIRSLMERATIYRAISAPTALVGGLGSIILGTILHFRREHETQLFPPPNNGWTFVLFWGAVLLITGAANTWFLAREARRRGGAFLSPGMRKALGALFPALLAGGVFTIALAYRGMFRWLPMVWMVFYGLALLSAAQFSPRAIPRLGWAFLFSGLVTTALLFGPFETASNELLAAPHLLMALTFGGLHLLYAVCTWATEKRDEAADV